MIHDGEQMTPDVRSLSFRGWNKGEMRTTFGESLV
jgi:hypothetical protein